MIKRSLYLFCFLFILLLSALITPFSFTSVRAETFDATDYVSNGDFSSNSYTIYGSYPEAWNLNKFEYINGDCVYSNVNDSSISTVSDTYLPAGIYEYSANAKAEGGEANISLGVVNCQSPAEKVFSVTDEQNTVKFYIFREQGESVKFKISVNALANGATVYIDDVSVKPVSSNVITTQNGASLRTDANNPGLRFKGEVDKSFYDECVDVLGENNVTAGIMIMPEDGLTEKAFTAEELGEEPLYIEAKTFYNETTAKTDGYYGFNCAVTEIRLENTDRRFAARAYIKYTINGSTQYIYADYDKEKHCRSVYETALMAKEQILKEETQDENILSVINAYCDKISIKDFTEDDFQENEDGFYVTLNVTNKCIIKPDYTLFSESKPVSPKVTVGEKTIACENGFYLIKEAGQITIAFDKIQFSTSYICPVTSMSIKIYSAS